MFNFLTSADVKAMPSEVLNRRMIFATLSACMAGSLFGFDTGNIGGIIVLPSFKKTFGLNVNGPNAYQAPTLSANIVTTLQAGAVIGALFAYPIADKFGRRNALIISAALFLVGAGIQLVAHLGTLYAGRVIAGIATGSSSVIAPMFVSENAPKAIRGALATCFNLMILISLSIAFWINYAVSRWKHVSDKQWRVPMAIQLVPGGLLLLGMLFQRETPRYLVVQDRKDQALENLCHIRQLPADHPYIQTEITEIIESVQAEKQAVDGASVFSLIKEIATVPSNRRRYVLAMILQVFQQMTGTNAINYYAPSIFASIGITGTSSSLLATGVYGIVKLITCLVYILFIVDNVGRRRPLMVGAGIQAFCLLYLAIFVKVANPQANNPTTAGGYVGVVAIFIYAFGWSFGWSVVPWVVPAEIFPSRIRAISMSSVYSFQWLLNFAITRSTPYMMLNMHKWGAYLLFSMFTFVGAVWVFFFLPELRGRSIESMDMLFSHSSFSMLKRAYPTEAEKVRQQDAVDVRSNSDTESGKHSGVQELEVKA